MKTYARSTLLLAAIIMAACSNLPKHADEDDASKDYQFALQVCAENSNLGRVQINHIWYVECRTGHMRRLKDLLKSQVI